MARYRITAPVAGVNTQIAGVQFVNSVGETDSARPLAYFRRHGYSVEATQTAPETPPTRVKPATK